MAKCAGLVCCNLRAANPIPPPLRGKKGTLRPEVCGFMAKCALCPSCPAAVGEFGSQRVSFSKPNPQVVQDPCCYTLGNTTSVRNGNLPGLVIAAQFLWVCGPVFFPPETAYELRRGLPIGNCNFFLEVALGQGTGGKLGKSDKWQEGGGGKRRSPWAIERKCRCVSVVRTPSQEPGIGEPPLGCAPTSWG
jgi:hypothetical protein